MENLVFTQLSIPEIRQLFREEIINVFSSISDEKKERILETQLTSRVAAPARKKRHAPKQEEVSRVH